jgi:hypothetical protein
MSALLAAFPESFLPTWSQPDPRAPLKGEPAQVSTAPYGKATHLPEKSRMTRRKNQLDRDVRRRLQARVADAVAASFPGFTVEFFGGVERSRMATIGPTLGFRLRDANAKYVSNVIWLNAAYDGEVTADWVQRAVRKSNG